MARPTRGPISTYDYINEPGDIYNVDLIDYIAAAGGFVATTDPSRGGLPGHSKMRHVGLVDGDGNHFTQPIADGGNTAYNAGGNLTVSGTVYRVTGRIGEHWQF
jgi:hypothetical protein